MFGNCGYIEAILETPPNQYGIDPITDFTKSFIEKQDLHRQEAGNKANEFKESDTMQFFHKNLIGIVSDVGCLLSILGLFLTIVIHMSFK